VLVCGISHGMDNALRGFASAQRDLEIVAISDYTSQPLLESAAALITADASDVREVTNALEQRLIDHVDGVVTLGFDNPHVVAALCERFGCPGLPVEVAERAHYKDRRIRALREKGFRTAEFEVITSVEEASCIAAEMHFPVIVKPTDRTNSIGVQKVESPRQLAAAVSNALTVARSGGVVVEEYLIGTEHTVVGVSAQGRVVFVGLSDRDYSEKERFAPYLFERGDIYPSCLIEEVAAAVLDTVERAVLALELVPAMFTADVLVRPTGEVILIELTPRMPGARIASDVLPLATGVDLVKGAIGLSLGREFVERDFVPRRAVVVIQRYRPARGGVLESIGDLTPLIALPRVHAAFWGAGLEVGKPVPKFRSNEDIVAGVIVSGDGIAAASALADEVLSRIPVRVRGEHGAHAGAA
jgi:biotin carboxylase